MGTTLRGRYIDKIPSAIREIQFASSPSHGRPFCVSLALANTPTPIPLPTCTHTYARLARGGLELLYPINRL